MCESPKPDYVIFSVQGAVKCCALVELFQQHFLAVGTSRGNCSLFTSEWNTHAATVYEDEKERPIVAVGHVGTSNAHLFVHVRAFAVLLFRVINSKKSFAFEMLNKWSTAYYGFCGTITVASALIIPNDIAEVKLRSGNDEKLYGANSMELKGCGALTCLGVLLQMWLVLGFEKGTLALFDIHDTKCVQKVEPFCEPLLSCATYGDCVAVSSVKSPFKILRLKEAKLVEQSSVSYPPSACGCGSLCFSPCGKQLASGYWDGSVRVHSVGSGRLRALMTLHSSVINLLCWSTLHRKRLLFVCSEDTKLSIWNLHKDP